MPRNSWYQAYAAVLAPLIATTALKWFAANRLEAEGEELHKAYMWRAGFYDVALFVASLHGPVLKPEVFAKLYGESYEDYAKEFKNE